MGAGHTMSKGLDRPVEVEPVVRSVRVAAVVPCFNRPEDLATLAADLRACDLVFGQAQDRTRIELSVVVVDNASVPELETPECGVPVRVVRLGRNTGGSGGYNAGMATALTEGLAPDYLWLVDSDARVEPDTLGRLVDAMERDPSVVALGPALLDTETGEVQEVGGRLDRSTGRFGPMHEALPDRENLSDPKNRTGLGDDGRSGRDGDQGADPVLTCDYVAACCALVRAQTVRRVGLFPEVFLNADDVEWCVRLAREGGGRVGVLPESRASHPRFDRFSALPRYFGARNAFGPVGAMGLGAARGRWVRFRRAGREVLRAINQQLMGRCDLAALHLRGLADALHGRTRGLPSDLPPTEPMRPLAELGDALRDVGVRVGDAFAIEWARDATDRDRDLIGDALRTVGLDASDASGVPMGGLGAALARTGFGPSHRLAIVPAKGAPAHWMLGRVMVEVAGGGFVVRRVDRSRWLARTVGTLVRGGAMAILLGMQRARPSPLPDPRDTVRLVPSGRMGTRPVEGRAALSLSVVVLSYNRKDALLETLDRLREGRATRDAEIVVVDNASEDGSVEALERWAEAIRSDTHAPGSAKVLTLSTNVAIAGFNRGVDAATGDLVLILDDDARPDQDALESALALLDKRGDLGAVTLVPYHPDTGASEWRFADALGEATDAWPVMGCCNLVRRRVWQAVGGYEQAFFLYRNDTDLAMKILATGLGVHCNPAWRCEHDSPAASEKSPRWCDLATRNWIWLARRHGRGLWCLSGAVAGWAWAHKLSGLSPRRHWATARGAASGWFGRVPGLPHCVQPDGLAWRRLMRLRQKR